MCEAHSVWRIITAVNPLSLHVHLTESDKSQVLPANKHAMCKDVASTKCTHKKDIVRTSKNIDGVVLFFI